MAKSFGAFKAWKRETNFKTLSTEQVVYSEKHGYAGSYDALGTIGQELTLVDFKTSSGIRPEYSLQIVAYKKAAEEMTGIPIEKALAVRVGKDGVLETAEYPDADYLFDIFLAVFKLWAWTKGI